MQSFFVGNIKPEYCYVEELVLLLRVVHEGGNHGRKRDGNVTGYDYSYA